MFEKLQVSSGEEEADHKTQLMEATGLAEFPEALPGTSSTTLDGGTLVEKLGEGVATSLALQFKNPVLQTLAYTGSQYVILEVSQLMFESLNGFTGANLQALSLAQIKMSKFRKSFNFSHALLLYF